MPHRRYGRRFSRSRIDPSDHLQMLRLIRAPKYIRARLERARAPAIDALLDPRRRAPASRPAKGCALKDAR